MSSEKKIIKKVLKISLVKPKLVSDVSKISPVKAKLVTQKEEQKMVSDDDKTLVIEILNRIASNTKGYSGTAFKKAALAFESYDGLVDKKEIMKIKGIGKSTLEVIMEVLKDGKSTRLNDLLSLDEKKSTEETTIELFKTIKYIGEPKAKELYDSGYRTIKELQELLRDDINNPELKLTHNQRLGIRYDDDLKEKIPRCVMDQYRNLFIDKFECKDNILNPTDEEFRWAICGSYRRGLSESGDIDLIVMSKEIDEVLVLLKDYIVETFVKGNHKFGGLIKLSDLSTVRQIDITVFEEKNWYYALLHSTGSEHFATLCRSRAKQLGYKILNTYGLYLENDVLVPANSEEQIMQHLFVEYIPPSGRTKTLASLTKLDGEMKIPQYTRNFRLLCYNIAKNNTFEYYNKIVDHIIAGEFDIVCLQEVTRWSLQVIISRLSDLYSYKIGNKLSTFDIRLPEKKQPKGQDVMTLFRKPLHVDFLAENLTRNPKRTMICSDGTVSTKNIICCNAHFDSKWDTDEATAIKASQLKQVEDFFEYTSTNSFRFYIGDTNFTGGAQLEGENKAVSDAGLIDLWEILTPGFDITDNDQKSLIWKTRDSTWRSPENPRIAELCTRKRNKHYRLDRMLVDKKCVDMIDIERSSITILKENWSDHDGLTVNIVFN
jgi:DNA polymerase beta